MNNTNNTSNTSNTNIKQTYKNTEHRNFAAIILAAGYSSRMKAFKPLLPVGKMTVLERLMTVLKNVGIEQIAVVTGYERQRLQQIVKKAGAMEVFNPYYDKGMFTSIQRGVEALAFCSGFFLMPVDCPLIDEALMNSMLERIQQGNEKDSFFVPVFEGKKGHPLYIPGVYAEEICSYGGMGGLKGITDKYWDRMVRVPVPEEGCVLDMDTPENYRELIEFFNNGKRRDDLQQLAAGRRIFLVRHGETMQHDEKMFIGQYDVDLNYEGKNQSRSMAKRISEYALDTDVIYASPLKRAAETAEILAGVLKNTTDANGRNGRFKVSFVESFKEIALGKWDGKPIREIREQYPEEYLRRGNDIFSFKTGNKAENFYDVQYRAVKALRNILKKDHSKDIIIVSHSAVIRALANNLRGFRVDDEWEGIAKGDFMIV